MTASSPDRRGVHGGRHLPDYPRFYGGIAWRCRARSTRRGSSQASSKAFNIAFDDEPGSAATSNRPYILIGHVKANVNGVTNTDFTVDGSASPATLTFGGSTTIAEGDIVEVYRETPRDLANRTVDFVKGALLTESDLDLSAVHNQFLSIEAIEGAGSVLATGSTTPRSLADRFAEVTNVLDHGAKGDGTTDDTAAIQSAIDSVVAAGGEVFVPAGDYKVTSTIQVNRPVMIRCEGWFDEATTATPSADASVTFKWAPGAPPSGVTSTMFCFSDHTPTELAAGSGLSGSRLFGCGIVGAAINGNDSLERGIWAASTVHGKFHIHVRQCKEDGVVVDGGAGALSERNEFRVDAMWGTADGTKPMNGVRTRRYNSYASTQNRFVSVNGTLFNGDHLHLEDTDNNIVEQLHGVTAGSGYALRFANGSTNHGRNNLAHYVHGDIKCESSTYGNRLLHSSSDGSKLEIDAGGHVHYDAMDFTNGEALADALLRDERRLPHPGHISQASGERHRGHSPRLAADQVRELGRGCRRDPRVSLDRPTSLLEFRVDLCHHVLHLAHG